MTNLWKLTFERKTIKIRYRMLLQCCTTHEFLHSRNPLKHGAAPVQILRTPQIVCTFPFPFELLQVSLAWIMQSSPRHFTQPHESPVGPHLGIQNPDATMPRRSLALPLHGNRGQKSHMQMISAIQNISVFCHEGYPNNC